MNIDLLLVDEVSAPGEWWLPGSEEHRVAGDFIYSPGSGIRVKLYGSLHAQPILAFTDDLDLKLHLVLGTVKIGRQNVRMTLRDCIEVSSSFPLIGWGFSHSELHAGVAFVGAHFDMVDNLVFDEMLFSANGLDEWASLSSIEVTQEGGGVAIKQQEVEAIPLLERDGASIAIRVINGGVSRQMVQKELVLSQRTYFTLKWVSAVTFDDAIRVASTLSDFLTLATGELAAPLQVTVFSEHARVEMLDGSSPYRERIQVLYQPSFRSSVKKPLPPTMTFTFPEEKNRLPELLGKWFDNAQELKPVHDLYFGTIRQGSIYSSQRFLNAVQALESFHRRTSTTPPEQLELAQQRIDRIKQATTALKRSDRSWLEWKLKYALEPSLQQRIEEIQADVGHLIPEVFEGIEMAHLIALTRHYLTHHDTSLEDRAVTGGADLYRLSEKVLLLVYVCLLSRLFDDQDLAALVQKDPIRRRIDWLGGQD